MIICRGSSDDLLILVTGGHQRVQKLSDLAVRPDFRIGPLSISPSRRSVAGPGGQVSLEPQIMHVLLLLLDARGNVVTRTTLFDEIWAGAMVGDDSLNRAIGKVRQATAEVAAGLIEIETIPRTGYRLVGGLAGLEPMFEAPAAAGPRLSRRTLVAGAAAVAAAAGGIGLWAADRSRDQTRFTALVEEAEEILKYEYDDIHHQAVPLIEQALAIRPNDASALGLLAYAFTNRALVRPAADRPQAVQAADAAVQAALAADPKQPNALLARLLLQRGPNDWAFSEDRLREILAIDPRNGFALGHLIFLLQGAGRLRLSYALNERAIALDPLKPGPQYRKALKLWIFGRVRESDQVIERAMRLWPKHPWLWNARFLILAFTNRPHAALDMIDDASARPDTITPGRLAQWRPTLAALEDPSPALVAQARAANLVAARQSPGQAAYGVMALSGLGEIDAAYDVANGLLLKRGKIVTRQPNDPQNRMVNSASWRNTQWLATPPLTRFRADPRFLALCDNLGLTAYWRARGIRPDYSAALRI